MRSDKIFSCLSAMIACLLIFLGGCAPAEKQTIQSKIGLEKQEPKSETKEPARLALKFTPGDSTTYRVMTQTQRSFKLEGPLPDNANKQGSEYHRVELTFNQQIQSINDKGNAIAKITIKGLKYSSCFKIKQERVIEFDSATDTDPNNPLAKLIGQNYMIEIAPTSEVIEVNDVNQLRDTVEGESSVNKKALALLLTETIRDRHGTVILPDANENQLREVDNWRNIKSFPFYFKGKSAYLGSKSYEKVYTLKEVIDANNHQIAIIDMNTIPTTKMAKQLHKELTATDLSQRFDSTGTYSGRLEFDLTSGKIAKYFEKLQLEWLHVDPNPSTGQAGRTQPAALRLGAVRSYKLERID